MSVALDLFTRVGYDGSSIDDIRQAAGFKSKASLYTHFKSKEEVAQALLTTILHEEEQILTAAYAGAADEPLARFLAVGRAFIEWGLTHPQEYAFCFLRIQQENVIRGQEAAQPTDAFMADMIARLRPAYPVRPLSDAVLLSMITGLINKAVIDQAVFGPIPLSHKTDQIIELCLAILFKSNEPLLEKV